MNGLRALALSAMVVMLTAPLAYAKDMPYKRKVNLKVGQSTLVLGVRSNPCGAPARSFSALKPRIPSSSLGTFSDGGVGTTRSNRCKRVVPARGVVFTAKKPGKERLTVAGDTVFITVR